MPTSFVVLASEAGQRLDFVLAARFPEYSRVRLRQWVQTEAILVNQRRRKAAYRVRCNDLVSVSFPDDAEARVNRFAAQSPGTNEQETIPLCVLHEDDQIIVLNKPHGMVVHPSKGHWQGTLAAVLTLRFGTLSQMGGAARPGIVHRLDRDTSGVMVVAKTDQVHLHLARQFEQRTVRKEYAAICRGPMDRDCDTINQPIGPHPYQREKMAIRSGHPASRTASTLIEVTERFRGFVNLRAIPHTGRTHQIRVHLAHVGCPVACDPLYSGQRRITEGELEGGAADDRVLLDRLALHAHRLAFDHPSTGERVEFVAPIPDPLLHFLEILRSRCPISSNRSDRKK